MGMRKGLGAAVGGVFGTAGKITGTAGKVFAILSFDEEYQRKRRQQQQRPPADLQVTHYYDRGLIEKCRLKNVW